MSAVTVHCRLAAKVSILAAAFVLGPVACRQPDAPLRVGTTIWPGYEPVFLARSLGYYRGRAIELLEFASNAEVVRAYRNGLIDVAELTADEALLATEGLADQRIVLMCDFSNGADAVLAKPEFRSTRDLKGRRVGVETTALGAYMLARALEHGGLGSADVTVVQVPLLEHESAYLSGRVDAVVTYEPYRSRILASGARQVFSSAEIPGEIADVLLTRRTLTASQDRAVGALVSGWFRALEYLRGSPRDAAAHMAVRESVTPEQFTASLQLVELPDLEANLRLLGNSAGSFASTYRRLSDVLLAHKLTPRRIEPPFLDDVFVRAARR